MVKNIIITGATSGFGKAIAEKFALKGYTLWLTGRRAERLASLKKVLAESCEVHVSAFDVRSRKEVEAFQKEVAQRWARVDVLINNAGLALGSTTLDEGDPDDWDTMIDTNVKGLLYMTRAIVPMMVAQQGGHIVNIGSTAGKMVYQNGNVYCATKFAVDALSQTMRIDLLPHHIKVTSVNPGMAETEFSIVRYKGDAQKAGEVYEGFIPLAAGDIADIVDYCVGLPEHVCINDLTVTCTQQANSIYKIKKDREPANVPSV
ncbi:MAG TPA: SDR family NAD(P)-dependent oxidoreductase [Edaphocola sp.]|nr:SDR family NAD(P)-dependent oxidoreductase [Edaphocola sp.]